MLFSAPDQGLDARPRDHPHTGSRDSGLPWPAGGEISLGAQKPILRFAQRRFGQRPIGQHGVPLTDALQTQDSCWPDPVAIDGLFASPPMIWTTQPGSQKRRRWNVHLRLFRRAVRASSYDKVSKKNGAIRGVWTDAVSTGGMSGTDAGKNRSGNRSGNWTQKMGNP